MPNQEMSIEQAREQWHSIIVKCSSPGFGQSREIWQLQDQTTCPKKVQEKCSNCEFFVGTYIAEDPEIFAYKTYEGFCDIK